MSKIDKTRMKDKMGRPLTQGLFLEIGYDPTFAIYSLEDEDREYKGVKYPSLKKIFIESEDVVEYDFAKANLLNWQHWQRLNANKMLKEHFDRWREELALSIRSNAVKALLDQALEAGNFQATKWLAEKGWDRRTAGRPSNEELKKEEALRSRLIEDFRDDIDRLKVVI